MISHVRRTCDSKIIPSLNEWSIEILRLTLGIVFLWFGVLKIINHTPVTDLIQSTYYFMPTQMFIFILGIWEVLIGLGLLTKRYMRTTIVLLLLQMGGVFTSLLLNPTLFFVGYNPFFLTLEGEFIAKNIVLIAAALVVGGHLIPCPPLPPATGKK